MSKRNSKKNIQDKGKSKTPITLPPGIVLPRDLFSEVEARWIVRLYLVFVIMIVAGAPLGIISSAKKPTSFWNKISKSLEEHAAPQQKEKSNQKVEPTVKTPVESGDEQGTAAHL